MSRFNVIQDSDRAYINRLVSGYRRNFVVDLGELAEPVNFNVGPWYLDGEFGYVADGEDADAIAESVYEELGLAEYLLDWTSGYEKYVVGKMIAGITFKGIHWGRTLAGRIIDGEPIEVRSNDGNSN